MQLEPINNKIVSEIKKSENLRKANTPSGLKETKKADSSEVSSSAQRLHDSKSSVENIAPHVASFDDIRMEKVEEVKKKIANGYYDSPDFIDKLADKMLNFFGITSKDV